MAMCKLINVVLTILGFFQIFISDHSFDIKDDLDDFLGYDLTETPFVYVNNTAPVVPPAATP